MNHREDALELLASKEAAGAGFFSAAAHALTMGLRCRWAGFGKLLDDRRTVEVISFWDARQGANKFSYDIEQSPCGEVYSATPDRPYRFYPDHVTDMFPGPPVLAQIGAVAYLGEAIFDSDGRQAAHAFAIDDKPFDADPQKEEFFRLVSQRAGAEYNRQCAEVALRRSREEAIIASRAKSDFLANMSHELRTPLNAILGFSDLLKSEAFGPLGDSRYSEYADAIHSSGHHLLDVISTILDISKIESGHMSLRETAVDVADTLGMCLSLVAERARRGNVAVVADYDSEMPPLLADPVKLKQVVINLLSNAVKFTQDGGKVTVSAGIAKDGGMWIRVADTGIGIAARDIPKALEPFRQINAAVRDATEGTGLGLPLSILLTRLHGGKFDFESEPGAGTTVTVRFPAERTLPQAVLKRHMTTAALL